MSFSPSFLEAAIPHLEPLLDIDILSAATTYTAYQSMVDKLVAIGFSHDIRGPLCR